MDETLKAVRNSYRLLILFSVLISLLSFTEDEGKNYFNAAQEIDFLTEFNPEFLNSFQNVEATSEALKIKNTEVKDCFVLFFVNPNKNGEIREYIRDLESSLLLFGPFSHNTCDANLSHISGIEVVESGKVNLIRTELDSFLEIIDLNLHYFMRESFMGDDQIQYKVISPLKKEYNALPEKNLVNP